VPQPPLLHRGDDGLLKLRGSRLYLNTAFAGPQIADVLEREQPAAVIYDQEFTELLSEGTRSRRRYVAWEGVEGADETTVEALISGAHGEDLEPPDEHGRYIILTSGTTGTPKGAQRSQPEGLGAGGTPLQDSQARRGDGDDRRATLPFLGFLHFILSLPTAATMILRPRFDPEDTLRATAEHRARVLAVVPVMMQRIVGLPDEVKRRYDLSGLEVTAASGSALPGSSPPDGWTVRGQPLQPVRLDRGRLGDDRHPRTCGRRPVPPGGPAGTVIRIVDEDGNDLPRARPAGFHRQPVGLRGLHRGGDKEHSETCFPRATSGTSTTTGACSSTAGTTR
jgi:fatty-acyl-CoA synthase